MDACQYVRAKTVLVVLGGGGRGHLLMLLPHHVGVLLLQGILQQLLLLLRRGRLLLLSLHLNQGTEAEDQYAAQRGANLLRRPNRQSDYQFQSNHGSRGLVASIQWWLRQVTD